MSNNVTKEAIEKMFVAATSIFTEQMKSGSIKNYNEFFYTNLDLVARIRDNLYPEIYEDKKELEAFNKQIKESLDDSTRTEFVNAVQEFITTIYKKHITYNLYSVSYDETNSLYDNFVSYINALSTLGTQNSMQLFQNFDAKIPEFFTTSRNEISGKQYALKCRINFQSAINFAIHETHNTIQRSQIYQDYFKAEGNFYDKWKVENAEKGTGDVDFPKAKNVFFLDKGKSVIVFLFELLIKASGWEDKIPENCFNNLPEVLKINLNIIYKFLKDINGIFQTPNRTVENTYTEIVQLISTIDNPFFESLSEMFVRSNENEDKSFNRLLNILFDSIAFNFRVHLINSVEMTDFLTEIYSISSVMNNFLKTNNTIDDSFTPIINGFTRQILNQLYINTTEGES